MVQAIYFIGRNPCNGLVKIMIADNVNSVLLQSSGEKLKIIIQMKMKDKNEAIRYFDAITANLAAYKRGDEFAINEEKAEDTADLIRSVLMYL